MQVAPTPAGQSLEIDIEDGLHRHAHRRAASKAPRQVEGGIALEDDRGLQAAPGQALADAGSVSGADGCVADSAVALLTAVMQAARATAAWVTGDIGRFLRRAALHDPCQLLSWPPGR